MNQSKQRLFKKLGFVFLNGGKVKLGTCNPLVCRLERNRRNETPERIIDVDSFWICKFCVTNIDFEKFHPEHLRPFTSLGDKNPVTNVTYLEALNYIKRLSEQHSIDFRLPTEPEWVYAAAPFGWEFPYQQACEPLKGKAHTFDKDNFKTINVDDDRYGFNHNGILHMGGNVLEMTQGWYYTNGHYGAETDGAYFIAKGGSYGNCSYGAGVQRRGIFDVASRSTIVGIRLVTSAEF